MPINPNIALGAQQPQPVNMLGQVGQMLALKAATDEMRGNEEMRNLFAGGANFDDPEFQRRGYAANPKAFQELLGKRATTRKTEMEALKDEVVLRRDALNNVSTPEDYLKWHEANHTGRLGAFFKSAGINPSRESIIAQLSQPGGLDKLKRASALGATQLEKELMQTERSVKVAGIGAAATMRGQDLLEKRERDKMALTAQERSVVSGEGEYYQTDKFGNIYRVPGFGALRGPNAPAAPLPPAAANAFITTQPTVANALAPTQPTQPPVNALVQPGSPTVANAAAIEAQNNIPRPKQTTAPTLTEVDDPANPGQKLKIDARVYRGGTVGDPGVLGVARTENLTPAQKQKLKQEIGKDFDALNRVVGQTNELMESIDAVRNSSLEKVSGPIDARTPSLFKEAQVAETRFNNLKGKVTAIAKANASLGGAIGSIANQEWQILANQIAVLDLAGGKTANLEQIEQLERQAMSIVNRMRDGFERKYGADIETLAPQYKEIPSVSYTPGQYTATGRKSSGIDNTNPWLK